MKKYRRALALVSCLSLCSLVWCVSSAAGFSREGWRGRGTAQVTPPNHRDFSGAGLRGP